MKFIYLFIILLVLSNQATALKLKKFNPGLSYPWGMTWVSPDQLLITQKKSYEIVLIDTLKNTSIKIDHDIPVDGREQGGLLDVISEGNNVWITCSIKKDYGYTTAVFRAKLENNKLVDSQLIFEALPYITNGRHFGSRMTIKDEHLYVSIGERGKGMIAQDPSNAIGSIIRINKDGSIPKDNPYVQNPKWLHSVYQIGVRNPQGMDLDPLTNYGWKRVAWGGKNYSGSKIGEGKAWEQGLLKPNHIWVPSIGVGGIKFYKGNLFPEWENALLIGSLKFQYLSILERDGNNFKDEKIIFKNKIGRIRDIEINSAGEIFLIADEPNTNLYKLTR